MGDVLLQVLLHAQLAEELPEDERWNIDDVAGDFVAKMIRRNPHVFGGVAVENIDEIIANWERVKAEEKGGTRQRGRGDLVAALADAGRQAAARAVDACPSRRRHPRRPASWRLVLRGRTPTPRRPARARRKCDRP